MITLTVYNSLAGGTFLTGCVPLLVQYSRCCFSYLEAVCYIRNLRTRRVVMIKNHLLRDKFKQFSTRC